MKRRVAHFASEAEMCARFIAIATGELDEYGRKPKRQRGTGWIAYPETAGWDILLVRQRDGFQIGLQAKLRLNDAVIMQTLEDGGSWSVCSPGPDCRAVLVPHGTGSELHRIMCRRAGVQIVTIRDGGESEYPTASFSQVNPALWLADHDMHDWVQMLPTRRAELPPVVPDVPAGMPSPLQLTAWKVKAIKIAVILEKRGWLCRQDFRHIQIDHRRFLDSAWLVVADGAWRAGPGWPDFKRQHPKNYDEIAALFDNWKPAELPLQQQPSHGRLV